MLRRIARNETAALSRQVPAGVHHRSSEDSQPGQSMLRVAVDCWSEVSKREPPGSVEAPTARSGNTNRKVTPVASITKLGSGKQPPRAIDFVDADENGRRKRKRVRLGIVTHREALEAKLRIEKLLTAKRLNQSIDAETAAWLAGVSDDIHEKIARHGLCEPRVPEPTCPTLREWIDTFLDEKQHTVKASSLLRLRQTAERLAGSLGEQSRLNEITTAETAAWRASMLAEELAEATVRLHCRNAKTIFAEAVDRELIARNPCGKLKSATIAANRDRFITAEETVALLDAAPNLQWRLLIALGRLAGLRVPSESHLLKWGHVDWERSRLQVYAPKTDQTRFVPAVPELLELLREGYDRAADGESDIITLSRRNLQRNLNVIARRAGVAPWPAPWQTLRRSAETMFAMKYPQHAVSGWIGHSVAVSLKHYVQTPESVVAQASSEHALSAAESAAETRGNGSKSPETSSGAKVTVRAGANEKAAECWGKQHSAADCEGTPGGIRTPDRRIRNPLQRSRGICRNRFLFRDLRRRDASIQPAKLSIFYTHFAAIGRFLYPILYRQTSLKRVMQCV
ncbi:tyrosine-type recombinase/integrase [bacterium]|nr:tyrosine-type recombinase/integrase [bacterium]